MLLCLALSGCAGWDCTRSVTPLVIVEQTPAHAVRMDGIMYQIDCKETPL